MNRIRLSYGVLLEPELLFVSRLRELGAFASRERVLLELEPELMFVPELAPVPPVLLVSSLQPPSNAAAAMMMNSFFIFSILFTT
jgi:hypothetical protein